MQDNFDDLWMNQHEFYECTSNLKYNLIQALLVFDGGALGQLPHYITFTQLIQTFTKLRMRLCAQLDKSVPAVKQEFQAHTCLILHPLDKTL